MATRSSWRRRDPLQTRIRAPTSRRPTDRVCSAPPEETSTMPSRHSYVDLLEANHWIRKVSDSFFWQCTTRTVQESKLFPVNPYICLSYYNAWYRYPELLRKVDAALPAEEIGDRAREVSSYVNLLTTSLISQFYLGARQFQIDMGLLRPTDAIDDVMFVMDF